VGFRNLVCPPAQRGKEPSTGFAQQKPHSYQPLYPSNRLGFRCSNKQCQSDPKRTQALQELAKASPSPTDNGPGGQRSNHPADFRQGVVGSLAHMWATQACGMSLATQILIREGHDEWWAVPYDYLRITYANGAVGMDVTQRAGRISVPTSRERHDTFRTTFPYPLSARASTISPDNQHNPPTPSWTPRMPMAWPSQPQCLRVVCLIILIVSCSPRCTSPTVPLVNLFTTLLAPSISSNMTMTFH
jgi:hypothetical protein